MVMQHLKKTVIFTFKKALVPFLLYSAVVCLLPAAQVWATDLGSPHDTGESQMKVHGQIVEIRADAIKIKTPTANYSVNRRTVPLHAQLGDTVTLWVTTKHIVIDHHRQTTGLRHRFVIGTLLDAGSKNRIKLWTPEDLKVYPLAEHHLPAQQFHEGTMVRVEINEAGQVIGLDPVEAEVAGCDKRHHCKVMMHGMVRVVEEGMIFIKTPMVEYEVVATMATPDILPGDEMTLWANENQVVLDHYRAGEMNRRRFVTGPLKYADKLRAHVTLWTPEGEQTFPLPRLKAHGVLREERPVTLEINENGEVIDLWQSS